MIKSIHPSPDTSYSANMSYVASNMPTRRAKSQQSQRPRNMTGLYLGLESGTNPPRSRSQVPPLARGRGMSTRVRTPTEERRYKMVELLRIKEEKRGFVGNPVKPKKKPDIQLSPEISRSQSAAPEMMSPEKKMEKLFKKTPRNFTAVPNNGVTHLEYLNYIGDPGQFDDAEDGPVPEATVAWEVDRIAKTEAEKLMGLEDCYKKVCKGNIDALHSLLPQRRIQRTPKDSANRDTGFAIKSYRNPHQAELLAEFPQDSRSRAQTVMTNKLLLPAPYFFRAYSDVYPSANPKNRRSPFLDRSVETIPLGTGKILGAPGVGVLSRSLSRGKHTTTPHGSTLTVNEQQGTVQDKAYAVRQITPRPSTQEPGAPTQTEEKEDLDSLISPRNTCNTPVKELENLTTKDSPSDMSTKDSSQELKKQNSENKENNKPETDTKMAEVAQPSAPIMIDVQTEDGERGSVVIDVADEQEEEDLPADYKPVTTGERKQSITERVIKLKTQESLVQSMKEEAQVREKEFEKLLNDHKSLVETIHRQNSLKEMIVEGEEEEVRTADTTANAT